MSWKQNFNGFDKWSETSQGLNFETELVLSLI